MNDQSLPRHHPDGQSDLTSHRAATVPTMMSPPPPFQRSSQSRPDPPRQPVLASEPSDQFVYDDNFQQDGEGFSQTQRDVPRSQLSESDEISGTQLDPRQKYCRLILLFRRRTRSPYLCVNRGSLHALLPFSPDTKASLAIHNLLLRSTRPGRNSSSRLHRTSPYRTGTLSAHERRRAHAEADLESTLRHLSG